MLGGVIPGMFPFVSTSAIVTDRLVQRQQKRLFQVFSSGAGSDASSVLSPRRRSACNSYGDQVGIKALS